MAKSVTKTTRSEPKKPVSPPVSAPQNEIEPASVGKSSDHPDKIERFAIPLDPETGAIVVANMRDATREKLIKAIASTPDLAPAAKSPASPEEQALNAMLANVLYDAVSSVSIIIARSRGFSASSAQLLRYTDQEKTSFIAPTMAVLDKYDLLKSKYREEIMLAAIVGTITGSKIMAMQRAEAAITATEHANPSVAVA